MTTSNPRVHVTLSPSLDAVVSRFAAVQRTSKSDVLRELVEAAAPALARAVALMEAASRAKPEMLRGMAAAMAQAQARIEGIVEGSMGTLEVQADLVEQAESVRGRRPRRTGASRGAAVVDAKGASPGGARSATQDPPPSNRGVRHPSKPKRKGKPGGQL
jgi:hypothetical protein